MSAKRARVAELRRKRQARDRARRRRGEIVLMVPVKEHPLALALINAGRLDEKDAYRRERLEEEAARLLRELTERWREWLI